MDSVSCFLLDRPNDTLNRQKYNPGFYRNCKDYSWVILLIASWAFFSLATSSSMPSTVASPLDGVVWVVGCGEGCVFSARTEGLTIGGEEGFVVGEGITILGTLGF